MSSHNEAFKLEPEFTQDDEFKPFDVSKAESDFKSEPGITDSQFHVPDWYWDSLTNDPFVKQQLEKIVDIQAKARAEVKLNELREAATKEGHEAGVKLAQEELAKEVQKLNVEKGLWVEEAGNRISKLIEDLISQKESLLRDHESRWAKTLLHILRRFHVGKAQEVTYSISDWIEQSLQEFKHKGKIRIYVAKSEFEKFKAAMVNDNTAASNRWELVFDDDLRPGEIRCDCGEGGALFSQAFEESELDRLIEGAIAKNNVNVT